MHVRNKGHNGEREFAQVLRERFPRLKKVERNVDQVRDGGADIISVKPFAIEVKRQENLQINAWWKQACQQANKRNPVPVLVFRQNRKSWRVIMKSSDVLKGKLALKESRVEMCLDQFLHIVGIKLGM